ncbi:glycosyltransferase family 4 protein [Burkholderia sp. A9]|uniref:glycosyltransferase family 4 protein n=1 Tax=Burkholderia sp. A9 TaxID=1365108 RepID=UPI001F3B49E7|nr:glycosyltransferase [Burkholderia sp. A9]
MGYEKFARRFVHAFEDVRIVARSFPSSRRVGSVVTGTGVSFVTVGENRGGRALLASLPRLFARVFGVVRDAETLVIRFPGNIAIISMLVCLVSGKEFSVEVVADPEDYFKDGASDHPLRKIAGSIHCRATRFAVRHARSVRYVTRAYLQTKYPAGPDSKPFGFSDVYLPDSSFSVRDLETFSATGALRIVNVAMMHNHSKGHAVLLETVSRLLRQGVKIQLTLVGDGPLRARFEELADSLAIGDIVHFSGQVSSDTVREIVSQQDLFVLPSFQEGLPRAMLEAMASGTPALATTVGGIPEVLPAEDMFEPGSVDELVRRIGGLARNRGWLFEMSIRQSALASAFSYTALQTSYDEYCNYLVKQCVR